ncbi:MFS transporter [Nocardia blacklockiae]|uniref:MFS transporter n=1 Tax=Nocardia blacklockiae TaxID=480036 RepID=UPI001894FEA3|nr:MFS transporter [Nocardia blacklockiae]MBF6174951.1 MFS transporter [Nocardia blacklockiae]
MSDSQAVPPSLAGWAVPGAVHLPPRTGGRLAPRIRPAAPRTREAAPAGVPQAQTWPAQVRALPHRRALALVTVALLSGLLGADTVVDAVAAPRVAEYFAMDSRMSTLATVLGALCVSAGVLVAGLYGDRLGRRRMLLAGGALVAAGGVAAAYASGPGVFLLGRALTGVGLAASAAMALAIVPALFAPRELARVFGVWLSVQSVAVLCGTVLGGGLIDETTWRTGYFLIAVVAAVLVAAGWCTVPDSRAGGPRPLGIASLALLTVALAGLAGGVGWAARRGWTDVPAVAAVVGSAALFALCGWHELRRRAARVRWWPFTSGPVAAACLVGALTGFATAVAAVRIAEALRADRGLSTSMALVVVVPLYLGMVLGAVLSAQAQEYRIPVRALYSTGLLCCGLGFLALARSGAGTELWVYSTLCALVGFGVMWAQNPQSVVLLSAVPPRRAGSAAALKIIVAQVGFGVGLSVAVRFGPSAAEVTSGVAAPGTGSGTGLSIAAVALLAGALVVAVLPLPGRGSRESL